MSSDGHAEGTCPPRCCWRPPVLLVEQAQPDGIAVGIGSGPRSARERRSQRRRPPCARAPCPLRLCRTIPSASAHRRASRSSPRRAPSPSSPLPAACRGPRSCGGRSCDDQELGFLVVVGWADATENGRAGCAPIWASSPTCVPQRQPKNSASRVARCPPRRASGPTIVQRRRHSSGRASTVHCCVGSLSRRDAPAPIIYLHDPRR